MPSLNHEEQNVVELGLSSVSVLCGMYKTRTSASMMGVIIESNSS